VNFGELIHPANFSVKFSLDWFDVFYAKAIVVNSFLDVAGFYVFKAANESEPAYSRLDHQRNCSVTMLPQHRNTQGQAL